MEQAQAVKSDELQRPHGPGYGNVQPGESLRAPVHFHQID